MSIGDTTENAILDLVFKATAWTDYAINHTTTPQTQIGLSLHTADPGDAGTAATSEVTYTSYTRVNVQRVVTAATGWNAAVAGQTFLAANTDFPAGTGGSGTVTFFAAAKSNATPPTGAQVILWSGDVSPSIVTGSGVTPRLTSASHIDLL